MVKLPVICSTFLSLAPRLSHSIRALPLGTEGSEELGRRLKALDVAFEKANPTPHGEDPSLLPPTEPPSIDNPPSEIALALLELTKLKAEVLGLYPTLR